MIFMVWYHQNHGVTLLLFSKPLRIQELCSMTNKDKKQLARSLYIKSDLNRKQIAHQVACSQTTLRSWIEKEDWESIKEAETISRTRLLQDAYGQLKAINDKISNELGGVPNKELSDAKGVIRKEIEALTNMPLHNYVEVMIELTRWLQIHHPDKLLEVMELADDFIRNIAKDKGI